MTPFRDYSRFFTPPDVAQAMATLLQPTPGMNILEPSAGKGALVKAVKHLQPHCTITAIEHNPNHFQDLKSAGADLIICTDFLSFPCGFRFQACIANPPFGHDIDLSAHIHKMLSLLASKSRLVAIVPKSFSPPTPHDVHPLKNWATNRDGTTTEIKIVVLEA